MPEEESGGDAEADNSWVEQPAVPAIDPHELYRRLAAGDRTGGLDSQSGHVRDAYATPEEPTVYLTFDDGPSRWTPEVLDILREHEVPATFFVLGQSAEANPDILQRIVDEGHAIGNHTYNHKYEELYSGFTGFWEQVERTDEVLTRLTGQQVRLLRAPGGTHTNFDAFYFYYLEQAGYHVHDWTVDAGDSKRRGVPAEEIIANVKRGKLTHEVNVLMHDSAGHGETVKALPAIIRHYKEHGYRFAVLTESVEPASFRIGPLKWQREMSEEAHMAVLDLVRQADSLRHQTWVAQAESSSALEVLAGGQLEELAAQGWLPLRDWAAAQGAEVRWDAKAKIARLHAGSERLELHTASGTAVWEERGLKREPVQVAYRIEQDRLYLKRTEAERLWAMKESLPLAYHTARQPR
ncbi:polysaccharide deacetylase [Xylanibacillus composti]|nr:polysaccharide deacetylase [Xylanibacillus composti]